MCFTQQQLIAVQLVPLGSKSNLIVIESMQNLCICDNIEKWLTLELFTTDRQQHTVIWKVEFWTKR